MQRQDYLPADATTMLAASVTRWPGLELLVARDDIRRPTEWTITRARPTVIIHLGGEMTELETELEAHGGSRGPASLGECWIIPAGHRYASRARGKSIHYAVIYLEGQPLSSSSELASDTPFRPQSGFRDEFLHHSVRRLAELTLTPNDTDRMFGEVLSQAIFQHLYSRHAEVPSPDHSPRRHRAHRYSLPQARQLRDYIYDQLVEEISLEQLARLTRQTVHQLLLDFRATFGASPWQYIIAQRLRLAQRLLTQTPKDITTIAFEAGFSSHSHLTRAFALHLGCTPSTFRKNARSH